VDDLWKTLPVILNGGAVKVERSGRYVILETDFKLRVSYDTDHSVELKIPDAFSGEVCGMCGNYNNRRPDDFLMPDGQLAQNSNELGNSWIVYDKNDPSCTDQPPPPPPPTCPPEDESLYLKAMHSVVCLTSKDDLFSKHMLMPVRNKESPSQAGETLHLANSQEMKNVQAIAITRTCMTACPATCLDPQAPEKCTSPCVEGCECKDGYILSGGACVSKSQCGCSYNDQYYNVKAVMNSLKETVRGDVNVRITTWSPVYLCLVQKMKSVRLQNGLLGCYQPSSATCHIYGDPHYSTFDGTLHHFQGSCNYTVSETCANTHLTALLSPQKRNEHRGNPSWTAHKFSCSDCGRCAHLDREETILCM
ncbi:unnamed protein product, partial [Ranitomeya imitator]